MRVVLSATALLSFMSVWKAAALAIAELGVGAFFVVGLARALAGDWAPWVVLAAGVLSVLARAADIESWALFIPGGLIGRAEHAFGPRAAPLTAAAMLVERLVLAALACVLVGHHVADFVVAAIAGWPATARLTSEEVAGVLAVVAARRAVAARAHGAGPAVAPGRPGRVGRGGRPRRRSSSGAR